MKIFKIGIVLLLWLATPALHAHSKMVISNPVIEFGNSDQEYLLGFAVIENKGHRGLIFESLTSVKFDRVEFQVVDMDRSNNAIDYLLAPRRTLELKPGGSNIRLYEPRSPVNIRDIIEIEFHTNHGVFSSSFTVVGS